MPTAFAHTFPNPNSDPNNPEYSECFRSGSFVLDDCFAKPDSTVGTTLTTTVEVRGDLIREFGWTINKDVSPETLELFVGDRGNPTYTVTVDKDEGTDTAIANGAVCVNNGGERWTRGLAISVEVDNPPDNTDLVITPPGGEVDVSSHPYLAPGETHCYRFSVPFTPVSGDQIYRLISHTTITNHSGLQFGNPSGPDTAKSFTIPPTPSIFINNSIDVTDTNPVGPWQFDDDGEVSYPLPFRCVDDNDYTHDNTATAFGTDNVELGSSSATVSVICHALSVEKDANTSFQRDYDWGITKSSDTTEINVQVNQDAVTVGYTIDVTSTPVDSDWAVAGTIGVSNPASFAVDATVTDLVNNAINAAVNCDGDNVESVPTSGSIDCLYSASLPGANDGTNIATATIPNFDRTNPNQPIPLGTATSFSGNAVVVFGDPTTVLDECVVLSDDNPEGPQGDPILDEICQDATPSQSQYNKDFGPYATAQVTSHTNTACIATDDGSPLCDSVIIPITVGDGGVPPGEEPGDGCSLTIGYWKAHSNPEFNGFQHFGPFLESMFDEGETYVLSDTESVTSAAQAYDIFIAAQGNDQVAKIKAQLLAVLLNAEADADTTVVDGAIADAQDFLSLYDEIPKGKQGKELREQASALINILSSYNEGTLDGSPGHCTS